MGEFLRADAVAYIDGVENNANFNVGYLSGTNRVVRFPFTVGSSGAGSFEFMLANAYLNYSQNGVGDADKFAFAIAPQDGKSYANHNGADDGDTGDGTLVFEAAGSGKYHISGYVKKPIPPGDYYLWLFPNYKGTAYSLNFYMWYDSTFSAAYNLAGAAGLVRIKEGSQELLAVPIVKTGDTFQTLAATVKTDGVLQYCI